MKSLQLMRTEIDVVDKQIIALLGQRFELTERVGLYKAENALPAADLERESRQFQNYKYLATEYDISEKLVQSIFEQIIQEVITRHKKMIN
jgi:chorismate mutase